MSKPNPTPEAKGDHVADAGKLVTLDDKNFRLEAVIDGSGEYAEVALYAAYGEAEEMTDIPWPSDWPERVNEAFLKQKGFHVVYA